MPDTLLTFWHVAVAALGGLAVGFEREWSGHASGPRASFGGVRTFTLVGLVAGVAGWLWTAGAPGLSAVLVSGVGIVIITGYVLAYLSSPERGPEATTEVAGFAVLAAGILAGAGVDRLASALFAATLLLLVEKRGLHAFVGQIDDAEIRAGARFAVMAVIVLPLLPPGPYGPWNGIHPRQLWMIVLFLSGLSFCGFIARRLAGERGYAIAGTVGGFVSSTSATLSLSHTSQTDRDAGRALAAGALGASAVMFPRMLITTLVLTPALAGPLALRFIAPLGVAVVLALRDFLGTPKETPHIAAADNPLQLGSALKMAVVFQIVLIAVSAAQHRFGASGLYVSASLVGLLDVDAVVIAMAPVLLSGIAPHEAVVALVLGAIANTITKLAIALVSGRGSFRPLAAVGLALMAGALAAGLLW